MQCQRVCVGVGGLRKDPHLHCYTCRGKACNRQDTCATCVTWDEVQWTLYESRRIYKKKHNNSKTQVSLFLLFGGGVSAVPQAAGVVHHQPRTTIVSASPRSTTDIFTISPSNVLSQHRPMLSEASSAQHRPMLLPPMQPASISAISGSQCLDVVPILSLIHI